MICNHADHDKRNLDTAILYRHRNTDFQDLSQNISFDLKLPAGQMNPRLLPADCKQCHYDAEGLGQGGSKRSTHRSHSKVSNKQII